MATAHPNQAYLDAIPAARAGLQPVNKTGKAGNLIADIANHRELAVQIGQNLCGEICRLAEMTGNCARSVLRRNFR